MKVKINDTTYDVPTSWDKVKFIDFANSQVKGSLEKRLSHQTTIPEQVILELSYPQLSKLIEVVSFFDSLLEFYEPYVSDLNVGDEHYIKMEQSRQALAKSDNQYLAAIEITKIYTGKDISELSVIQAMGYAVFFFWTD